MTRVSLDDNATTPVEPAVMQALLPYFGPQFGNASSTYALGQNAKKAVEMARTQVASMLGASDSNEIVFLSGGTESINYAIKGSALAANVRVDVTTLSRLASSMWRCWRRVNGWRHRDSKSHTCL
ncbi:unnamed protein product [Peronospora effusa]|nr:unnamed protein product [Peronospora effusa]